MLWVLLPFLLLSDTLSAQPMETSSSPPPELVTDNATYREMFASKVLGQHVRYCSSNRLCNGYRRNPCWKCAPCQCDELCAVYDDCCPDKTLFGVTKPSHSIPPVACLSDLHDRYTEEEKAARSSVSKRYYMVASCPADADSVLTAACVDSPLLAPVISRQNVTYRNRHCAECWGADNTSEWKLQVDCDVFENLQRLRSPEAVLEFAMGREKCWVTYVAPSNSQSRQCYHDNNMISTCNVTGNWSRYDEALEWACHSYTTVRQVGNQTYRNVFCYICNTHTPKLFKCKFVKHLGTASFSALLDFSRSAGQADYPSRCSQNQLYDGQRKSCRDILCSQGKQLVNRTCRPIFDSAIGLGYELYFDMHSTHVLPLSGSDDLLHSLPEELKNYFPFTVDMTIIFHDFVVAFNTTDSSGMCSQQATKMSVYAHSLTTKRVKTTTLEAMLLGLRKKNFTLPMNSRNISFETAPNENARVIRSVHKGNVNKQSSCIISVSISNPFQSDDPDTKRGDMSTSSTKSDLNLIRVSNLLTCPQVRLETDEYQFTPEGIRLAWSNTPLPDGEFLEDDEGNVRICLQDFKSESQLMGEPDDEAEVIVSIVCTVLSLICLLLTFITYCLFKQLRGIPGKNNVNLTITLFSAQLLYLLGMGRTENKGLCEAIGIIIHYLWLAVFGAMAVCSFHMFRVFSTLRNREDSSEKRRLFLQYCVFIYGLPALLVVVTLVVHIIISDGAHIGYGGKLCYLSSGITTGIAFGIPVGLTILINLVFFVLTIRIIKNSPKVDKNKQDEHHAIVYIKLSTITGVTWVFAFLNQWAPTRYLFILLNASQGVFIFISFICTRRVVRLYSECCAIRRSDSSKPTGSSSCPSSPKSPSSSSPPSSHSNTRLTHLGDSQQTGDLQQ